MRRKLYTLVLLLMVTLMLAIIIAHRYWGETQYLIACAEFYSQKDYYLEQIANAPLDKDGLPKIVVFNWGGTDDSARLLVYDESDDLANYKSVHERLFDVWPSVATGLVLPPDAMKTIYQIDANNITGHFYLVFINYGKQPIKNILR